MGCVRAPVGAFSTAFSVAVTGCCRLINLQRDDLHVAPRSATLKACFLCWPGTYGGHAAEWWCGRREKS